MSQTLMNKVGLITGGARGIGKATALKLARAGSDIALVYYNSSDEAHYLVKEIEGLGRKAVAFQGNVADHHSVKEVFSQFKEHFPILIF